MQKTDHFFIKLIITLVVSILALVTIVYFMQNDWRLPNRVNNIINPNGSRIENDSIIDENIVEGELDDDSEMNAERDSYAYRRYLESHIDICESETFDFHCEETEMKFNDETGCGCELTKTAIAEEEEMREQMEEMELENNEDGELGYIHDFEDEEVDVLDPVICTMEYAPVCGIFEGEYKTFGNDCMAEGSGIYDYTIGECELSPVCGNGILEESEQCDGTEIRTDIELTELFPGEELPVCGCMPGLITVDTCTDDCRVTCHCEE